MLFTESFGKDVLNISHECSVPLFEACDTNYKASKLLDNFTWILYLYVYSKKDTRWTIKANSKHSMCYVVYLKSLNTNFHQIWENLIPLRLTLLRGKTLHETWVDWWKRPHVFKKLSKASRLLYPLKSGKTSLAQITVESINHQSICSSECQVSFSEVFSWTRVSEGQEACNIRSGITLKYHNWILNKD